MGIVHQVNLEYFAKVVVGGHLLSGHPGGHRFAATLINGLGVVAWGVGGIGLRPECSGRPVYSLTRMGGCL
jgi:aconitate hydratase